MGVNRHLRGRQNGGLRFAHPPYGLSGIVWMRRRMIGFPSSEARRKRTNGLGCSGHNSGRHRRKHTENAVSSFHPYVPRVCLMTSSSSPEQPQSKPFDLNGLCVLVVEDSWQVATGLKMLLESWGAEVMGPAATTAEAERLIAERTPETAIVDINLRHGERSYGLIDRLYDQGIRVVVMTGYADASVPPGKAAAVLQKPMKEDLLLASLRPGNE
jgi:CheY-like chemotaxis protein